MQIVGIIIIIWLVRALLNKQGSDSSGSTANNPPARWFLIYFFLAYCVVSAVSTLALSVSPAFSTLVATVGYLVFCFPSFTAQVTIRLGMVKASYYLGRLAQAVHTHDPLGGGLFYGWRALQYTKPAKRERPLGWLQDRLSKHNAVLRSGAMVMQVLFKHGTISDEQLMAQLRLLNGCNKRLIPGSISRYCFRYMLARDLPTGDWRLIGATTAQWLDAGFNPLARWLHEVYWNKKNARKLGTRLFLFYRYLLAGMPKIARYLPPINTQEADEAAPHLDATASLEDLKLAEWAGNSASAQQWRNCLHSQHDQWRARLQALGSYNPDEGLEKIAQSVQNLIAYRNSDDALESEQVSEERDRDFRLLGIKVAAVNQRLHDQQLMTGAQELEEFFAMVFLAQKLAVDATSESQVFYMLRGCCWNWMARLWNDAGHKPLAFLICSYMSILAYNASDTEAMEIFSGIVADRYK